MASTPPPTDDGEQPYRYEPEPAPRGMPDAWSPAAGDDEVWRPLIDPVAVIRGIMRSRKLIIGATIAGALLGVIVALSTPKTYYSAAEVLVDPRDIKVSDRQLTTDTLPTDATSAIVENQIRLMYSGMVLGRVVDKLDLDHDPEFNGSGGGSFVSEAIGLLRSLLSGGGSAGDGTRQLALAKQHLAENLDISRSGKTFVLNVGFAAREPGKAALVANTVVDVFLDAAGDLQSGTASRAASELSGKLDSLRKELQEAERKAETFRAQHDLVDAKGGLISDNEIVRINDDLTAARARTIELSARAETARKLDPAAVLSAALPEAVNSAVLSELRAQYATAKQQVDSAKAKLGPRHPQLVQLEAQLASVRDQISAELRRMVSSIQVELKRSVQQEQALASRLAQLKARQANVGDDLVQLRELEREAAAKRQVYENYLLRARESGEQKGLNTANISVISQAEPALLPEGISRSTIAAGFTILGFLAGIGIAGARGALEGLGGQFDGVGDAPARPGRPARTAPQKAASLRRRRKTRDRDEVSDTPPAPPQPVQPAPPQDYVPAAAAPIAAPSPAVATPAPPPAWTAPPAYPWPPSAPVGYWPPPSPAPWWPAPPAWPAQQYQPQPPVAPPGPAAAAPPPPPDPVSVDDFDPEVDELRQALREMRAKVRDLSDRRDRPS